MKTIKEVEVQLENKPGALSSVSELLGSNNVNILAVTVRTVGDVGMVNFVASEPDRVVGILESAGYSAGTKEIIAAETPHHPGGLNALLKPLRLAGVNVEYLYAAIGFLGSANSTILMISVDNLQAAHDALVKEWIQLYGEELYNI
jgi:hypothetical protein